MLGLAVAGCSSPDAATTNRRAAEDRFSPSVLMEGKTKDAAVDAMRAPTADHRARPLVAADGAGVATTDGHHVDHHDVGAGR